jgi:hypothetical protein
MHVAFYHSTKEWCIDFAKAFKKGAWHNGDTCSTHLLDAPLHDTADFICLLGAGFKETYHRMLQASHTRPVIFIDKGWYRAKDFTTDGAYFHMSVGAYRPSLYAGRWGKPPDRREKFGWWFKPWRQPRLAGHILLAWSSFKYHDFHGLPLPHEHAWNVVQELREHTDQEIVYRQKPNQPRHDVPGTRPSREGSPLLEDLSGCHALITVGSSACLEAMLMGVPSIILGDALMSPISSCSLDYIKWPYLAYPDQREQILNDLAYCQYHLSEYADGTAWRNVRQLAINKGNIGHE